MTENGISLEDKVNDGLDDISLEAILAEYGDFGLGVPPEDEVGARSRRIVMEALGETFAGVAESAEADDTAGLPDEDWEGPREYQPRRQRKARSRRREREELREYRPRRREPDYAPEPEYAPIGATRTSRSTAPAWAVCRRVTRTSRSTTSGTS